MKSKKITAKFSEYFGEGRLSASLLRLMGNLRVDRVVEPVSPEELIRTGMNNFRRINFQSSRIREWLEKHEEEFSKMPTYRAPQWTKLDFLHQKALEYYVSYQLLEPQTKDVFMDVGAQKSSYYRILSCREIYLQDMIYPPGLRRVDGRTFCLGGDAASLPLPKESVDKISLHHTFEHFEGGKDRQFIKQSCRILKPEGKMCIIPLLLGDEYTEVHRLPGKAFDPQARRVIDPTTTLATPFARIYNIETLQTRVLAELPEEVEHTLYEITVDDEDTPDMSKNLGVKINRPMRCLLIRKTT
ncbi:MAG: methyltransferase domain-containing protein [bacterium]